jgi:hypothetical protein
VKILPAFALCAALYAQLQAQTVHVLLKDGRSIEGAAKSVTIEASGRKLALRSLLSLHNGAPAGGDEAKRIDEHLAAIAKDDALAAPKPGSPPSIGTPSRASRDAAIDELTAIGLPVVSPLLALYKDTDQHEPRPLYRLYARLVPPGLDQLERSDSLIRLSGGEAFRAKVADFNITVNGHNLAWSNIRRLAVRQARVEKHASLEALQHCTQLEYLDTGIETTPDTTLTITAKGLIRNAFNQDGWASDADGLKVPGPNYKTNLVDGHPFGAVVARTGSGEVQRIGSSFNGKPNGTPNGTARFRLAVNDNRHWQNNVGAFKVTITATNAYDLGNPR